MRLRLFQSVLPLFAAVCVFLSFSAHAQQPEIADKIVAVVGKSRIILKSELENQLAQARQENPGLSDTVACNFLQQMMMNKLLMEQAERDSVVISEEDVEGTLENRLRYFVRMYGSKEKLEQMSGKTVYQIKEENREAIKEEMLAQKMQGQLLQNVKITPAEVRAFYEKIPKDSLPFFPASVEVGQIVIDPAVSPELDQYARKKLEDIRKQIVTDGKSFEAMAGLYSDDPGSRDNGGDLGQVSRGDMVPEFSAAAWRLQNGEISPIVKTKFGYHVIQMIRRQGDQAQMRHILIRPERSSGDFQKALTKLDSVRSQLIAGTLSFSSAVGKYSTDDQSKVTGGMIADQTTGSSQMEVEKLDPSLALMIDSLKPGSYSQPQVFTTQSGERSCRIVYMRSRTEPHKANLKDDYNKIQDVALGQKKNEHLQRWLIEKIPTYYIKIDPQYGSCGTLKQWTAKTE